MDTSDTVTIEVLRPKTVPEGLIALGTVVQVLEVQVKLQITGGILCIVDRFNISKNYTNLIERYNEAPEKADEIPKLSQLFKRGEQYVCKVIERRPRKGYAEAEDIIATLEPSAIQEDNVAKSYLSITHAALQCSVSSLEDHGYIMNIGFPGLSGFLAYKDAGPYKKRKLMIGQVLRCCLKSSIKIDDDSRVVQLSLEDHVISDSHLTLDKVQQHVLTPQSFLPGTHSFLTVMKVLKNGLIVNFANEYSGFVNMYHLKEEWHVPKNDYKVSDQIICTVLYYNQITKLFALSIKPWEKYEATLKHFLDNYHVGQMIKKAKVAYIEGTRAINFKIENKYRALANVKDALDEDIGVMTRDEISSALDEMYQDNSTHCARIKSLNLSDLIIILSLRADFKQLPVVSVEELKPADFLEATIKKYVKDGIVVTYGLNLRAIILNTYLEDYVTTNSYKKYPLGKKIQCRVLNVEFDKQPPRVYLTNKIPLMNKSLTVVKSYDKSLKGKSTHATIIKVKSDGALVELFNDVKGFIPKRFLTKTKVQDLSGLFKVGQVIECCIYRVDPKWPTLLLGAMPFETIMQMKNEIKQTKELKKQKSSSEKEKITAEQSINAKLNVLNKKRKRDLNEDKDSNDDTSNETEDTDDETKSVGEHKSSDSNRTVLSRLDRSKAKQLAEEKLRDTEQKLADPHRQPQSIGDFERLVLKEPNSADVWIKYSKFFLDNIETEKARIVLRRALRTINFRQEKEKLKIWLYIIKLEAKFGGSENLQKTIEEAAQTNDKMSLYRGCTRVLTSCGNLDEAESIHQLMLKSDNKSVDVWIDYIKFLMEHRGEIDKARALFDKGCKNLPKPDQVLLKSRFAQTEFRLGDVERGKTIFENILSDNPKRTDLWRVYADMIRKFQNRQGENQEALENNRQILSRIQENIEHVSKKRRDK